jgi:hypothetical protein
MLASQKPFRPFEKVTSWPGIATWAVAGFAGGMLGLALSFWGTKAFATLVPQWYPQAQEISIDVRVLAFTLAISILTGIMFGLARRCGPPKLS